MNHRLAVSLALVLTVATGCATFQNPSPQDAPEIYRFTCGHEVAGGKMPVRYYGNEAELRQHYPLLVQRLFRIGGVEWVELRDTGFALGGRETKAFRLQLSAIMSDDSLGDALCEGPPAPVTSRASNPVCMQHDSSATFRMPTCSLRLP